MGVVEGTVADVADMVTVGEEKVEVDLQVQMAQFNQPRNCPAFFNKLTGRVMGHTKICTGPLTLIVSIR